MADITTTVTNDTAVLKTLANCTLPEFLRQTNKIRHAVSDFYQECDFGGIMKRIPTLTGEETAEERREKINAQSKQNLSDVLDVCLDTNAEKTVEIVGLMCFKTAEEAAQMDAGEFLDVAFSLLGSQRVIDFFTKLGKSGLIDMVKP